MYWWSCTSLYNNNLFKIIWYYDWIISQSGSSSLPLYVFKVEVHPSDRRHTLAKHIMDLTVSSCMHFLDVSSLEDNSPFFGYWLRYAIIHFFIPSGKHRPHKTAQELPPHFCIADLPYLCCRSTSFVCGVKMRQPSNGAGVAIASRLESCRAISAIPASATPLLANSFLIKGNNKGKKKKEKYWLNTHTKAFCKYKAMQGSREILLSVWSAFSMVISLHCNEWL